MEYNSPVILSNSMSVAEDNVVWYVVAIAILALLAVSIVGACVLFCIAKGKNFSGSWSYTNGGGSVKLGCK